MSVYAYSAAVAIGLGALVGVLLFVPFVAISYRRRGGLSVGRFIVWASALVYFLALWTYTLLPLPRSVDYDCLAPNFDLSLLVSSVIGAIERGHPFTDFALLQIVFNVLLFVPLGFFVRVLGGRGVLVALGMGFGISLLIETSQLTGVWGLFPCAYRYFDVGDLATNTAGAVVGSLLALLVPRRHRGKAGITDAGAPRPVTRGRRVLAFVCDAVGIALTSWAASVATQLVLEYGLRDHDAVLDGSLAGLSAVIVPVTAWLIVILGTGQSVGDLAVELRYVGGPLPEPVARLLRFVGGAGGYLTLSLLPSPWSGLSFLFATVAVVLLFTTSAGRGLPGILSARRLVDARE